MPSFLLSHLLGIWLLLDQLPRARSLKDTDRVKLCGRELIHFLIQLCGEVSWRRGFSGTLPSPKSIVAEDNVSSYINHDTEMLNKIPEVTPNFLKEGMANEEPTEVMKNRANGAGDDSLSKLKGFGLEKLSRPKTRQEGLVVKCCKQGCRIKELKAAC
ncbi:PREDICTED: prorelaxin-like [Elephantulus edwardii]|uniref:prorelaxin-like n=1 Tax=Elephantulus edwardii TaxID=28737 RepID=UPI0003F0BFD7|nr:PREDICTED: prorelaxin-like [Elephantulus edwardii]